MAHALQSGVAPRLYDRQPLRLHSLLYTAAVRRRTCQQSAFVLVCNPCSPAYTVNKQTDPAKPKTFLSISI